MKRPILTLTLALLTVSCAGPATDLKDTGSKEVLAYEQAWKADLAEAEALFKQLEQLPGAKTVKTILEPLNDLYIVLYRGIYRAGLYSNVHPDPQLRTNAEEAEQAFSKLATEISLSRPLFEAVSGVDASQENPVTQRFLAEEINDFKRAGVDKDSATRDKIRQLQEELVQTGQAFGRNIREDVRSIQLDSPAEPAGMPQD